MNDIERLIFECSFSETIVAEGASVSIEEAEIAFNLAEINDARE